MAMARTRAPSLLTPGSPLAVLLLLVLLLVPFASASVLGASASKASLYAPQDGKFRCLDSSKLIDFAAVNDDFCDCSDGSDEPGTSACPNGVFACKNVGYFATSIPSSRVNDAICDCCDGSDEPPAVCPNTCTEKGAAARTEAEKQHRAQRQGYETKQKLIVEGTEGKEIRQKSISELQLRIAAIEKEVDLLKADKEKAEEEERVALEEKRKREESQKPRIVTTTTNLCEDIRPKLQALENEANFLREILEGMKGRVGHIRSSDIESAIAQAEKVISEIPPLPVCSLPEAKLVEPPADEASFNDAANEVEENEEDGDLYADDGDGDDDGHVDHEEHADEEASETPAPPAAVNADPSDPLVQAAALARENHAQKERELSKAQQELRELERIHEFDFGPQNEFFSLYNKCFQFNTPEYTYEMCPFGSATQKQKRGGGDTHMGAFKSWANSSGERSMKFEHGLRCWGGPDRSVQVKFLCGGESEIISVEEPAKCEYAMEFRTPAACQEPQSFRTIFFEQAKKKDPKVSHEKDEL